MRNRRHLQHDFEGSPRIPARFLGEYELIAELARGGMGRVFLARRQGEAGFERLYAIKVMHDYLTDEPDAVGMLLDEATIASKLHHPNVVPIVDIGCHEQSYYLVMDYVEGCSLSELLRRTKDERPAQRIVTIILDALRGLHAAQELTDDAGEPLELIHRDFSPQNLLIGVDGSCRVTDFGIAKASARLTHTRSTVQKGKISYMSPEQLTEEIEIDKRVDLWAAGVVLWQALTGEHPFKSTSEAATIHKILERQVPPPSTVGLRPPRAFDAICLKALSRDREQRFHTAQEMADELQRVAVRNDCLAPQSEIARWIRSTFETELEERKQLIRTIKEQGSQVAWLDAPKLPRLALTPSTSWRHGKTTAAASPIVEASPTPPPPSRSGVHERVDSASRLAPRQKKGRPQRAQRKLKTILGVALGGLLGFAICMVAFISFRSVITEEESRHEQISGLAVSDQTSPEPAAVAQKRPRAEPPSPALEKSHAPSKTQGTEIQEPSVARVILHNVPVGATIRLDGVVVEGQELSIPIDGLERVLRVDHPDYLQWLHAFIALEDQTFQVQLRPRPRQSKSPSRPSPEKPPRAKLIRDPGF